MAMQEDIAPARAPRARLGEVLLSSGLVTEDQLMLALAEQKRTGDRLGRILVAKRVLTEAQLTRILAEQFGTEFVDLDDRALDYTATRLVRESFARRHQALAIGWEDDRLVVAMANPADVFAIDDIRSMTGQDVRPVMVEAAQLKRAIDRVWSTKAEDIMKMVSDAEDDRESPLSQVREAAEDAPVVQFVNELVTRAVQEGASDVHLEPGESELRIRFRIDGVLQDVMRVPRSIQASVISRLKIMGELDIAERRVPQDGRITVPLEGRRIDLRLVTLPTAQGESLVIRVLDRKSGLVGIDDLGFLPQTKARYEAAYRKPWGAILVTGPTGSGKTTTLYATLGEVNDAQRSIITVEDPVEYRMASIKQVQVNRKAGLTFATALRSILRADPDVVLVGEIRDRETATIAVEAALTGHLVLSTLHTNDAASTPARLLDMGVEPFLVTSAVSCVLAQRLARRLCERCKEPCAPSEEELLNTGWPEGLSLEGATFFKPVGCGACNQTGYRGRFAVHEVMPMTEGVAALVLQHAPTEQVRTLAVEEGMLTLRTDGLHKVARGDTSIEELLRVVA
ncbi:MAG TPA: ATPase, T2SS/T4P/T4SS family [Acidimicrobiales bacterium]|nr:ATPase, T2SS/T4P/T4SS family [Acidimicrobiales bacterium]